MGAYLESGGQLQLIHSNIPVGKLTDYFVTVDKETGELALAVYGLIFNDGRSVFDRVWEEFVKQDSTVGFSIGGKPMSFHSEIIKGKTVRFIDELELYEVSVICSIDGKPHAPANSRAKLLSLGHNVVDQPIPIVIKMVLDMPKNDINEKEEEKPEETEDKEEDSEETEDKAVEDEKSDIAKRILEEVKAKASEMMGGSAALEALQNSRKAIEDLKKTNADLKLANQVVSNKFVELTKQVATLETEKRKVQIERDAWMEIFKKNTSNKDTLEKLITQGRAVVTEGGMPPNQGTQAPIVTKEIMNTKLMNKEATASIDEFFKSEDTSNYSDEEFLKRIRAANSI